MNAEIGTPDPDGKGPEPRARTPLSPVEVEAIMFARVSTKPLSTVDIVDLCAAAYPNFPGITAATVNYLLLYLRRRNRVTSISGAERETLTALGVVEPRQRAVYWIYRGIGVR